ncbi:hypothetical protein [Phaeocystidibacter marisrubri]|uniref:Uncharacterized protein n=1 Tax=Phaeocystidibacter marisrubri TaxID=1577780 RepID=A0A6L3ZHW4_9FLAO|nr:hypothetical protein [Phaeocystidibacter marisrubri]KAB2816609.1 hypothetical protein F8C82_13085 [Phaeocystidibacter marisrubri]GGH69931.1 hypothetical protein GCM10011318_11460 [Phaeocystidibacter marisrubri]
MKEYIFGGDFLVPLRELNINRPVSLNRFTGGNELQTKINKWASRYDKYAPIEQLEKYKNEISELDEEGITLLREIKSLFELNGETEFQLFYLSLINGMFCIDSNNDTLVRIKSR